MVENNTKICALVILLLSCFHNYVNAINKCCTEDKHYNVELRKCESVINQTDFTEIVSGFKDSFVIQENIDPSDICLDKSLSGLNFIIIEKNASSNILHPSYCFAELNFTSEDFYDGTVFRSLKLEEADDSNCEEGLIVSDDGIIHVLAGNKTESYTAVYSNVLLPLESDPHNAKTFYRKCCRKGELWTMKPGRGLECIRSRGKSDEKSLIFWDGESQPYIPSVIKTLPAPIELLTCEYLEFYGLSAEEDPIQFSVLQNGSLLILPDFVLDMYCTDVLLNEDGEGRHIIMTCPTNESVLPNPIQPWLYSFFYAATLPFLLATLVVYLALPELQNQQGKIVIGHVFSLFSFFLLMLIVSTVNDVPKEACVFLGIAAHFFYLSSFSWLSLKGLHLMTLWSTSFLYSDLNSFWTFCFLGWGLPAVIVTFATTVQFGFPNSTIAKPGYGVNFCFLNRFSADRPLLWYLYLPLGVFLLVNIVTFLIAATKLTLASVRASKMAPANKTLLRSRLLNVLRISIVMGLTWVFDLISFVANSASLSMLWVVIDILNILTAIYIFYFYICKKRVAEFLYTRYSKILPCLRRYDTKQGVTVSGQQRKTSDTAVSSNRVCA